MTGYTQLGAGAVSLALVLTGLPPTSHTDPSVNGALLSSRQAGGLHYYIS